MFLLLLASVNPELFLLLRVVIERSGQTNQIGNDCHQMFLKYSKLSQNVIDLCLEFVGYIDIKFT